MPGETCRGSTNAGSVAALLLSMVATLTGGFEAGCSRSESAAATSLPARPTVSSPPDKSVELSNEQIGALTITPIGTRLFGVEAEALGSISFDEDPAIVQAEATLIGAAATFDATRKELARVQALGETNGIAPKELEQAISEYQTAAAALKSSRDAVRALGRTDPQIDRLIASGRFSQSAQKGSAKWVLANVTETDSPLVRLGQHVLVRVPAFPDHTYSGSISKIYAVLDPGTHRLGIRAALVDPNDELRPGMLANVTIRIAAPVESLAIPTTAAVREGDGSMIVWMTADRHRFVQRALTLGQLSEGYYQVLAGLQRGELAVTEGGVFLSNMLNAPPSD
jgi:cobalt-zinc-cadmium efflux system membrane fusion protein